MTWKMDYFPGVLVTPQLSEGDSEIILGLVVEASEDGAATVVWFSNRRGIFACREAIGDIDPVFLDRRDDIEDEKISHYEAARVLRGLLP